MATIQDVRGTIDKAVQSTVEFKNRVDMKVEASLSLDAPGSVKVAVDAILFVEPAVGDNPRSRRTVEVWSDDGVTTGAQSLRLVTRDVPNGEYNVTLAVANQGSDQIIELDTTTVTVSGADEDKDSTDDDTGGTDPGNIEQFISITENNSSVDGSTVNIDITIQNQTGVDVAIRGRVSARDTMGDPAEHFQFRSERTTDGFGSPFKSGEARRITGSFEQAEQTEWELDVAVQVYEEMNEFGGVSPRQTKPEFRNLLSRENLDAGTIGARGAEYRMQSISAESPSPGVVTGSVTISNGLAPNQTTLTIGIRDGQTLVQSTERTIGFRGDRTFDFTVEGVSPGEQEVVASVPDDTTSTSVTVQEGGGAGDDNGGGSNGLLALGAGWLGLELLQ